MDIKMIKVNLEKFNEIEDSMKQYTNDLNGLADRINKVSIIFNTKILAESSEIIKKQLKQLHTDMEKEATKMKKMKETLGSAKALYTNAENNIINNANGGKTKKTPGKNPINDGVVKDPKGGNVVPKNETKPKTPAPKNTDTTYKVVKGDTLWALAEKYYGDGSKYKLIYEANKDKIKNPDLIYPGQVFVIPGITKSKEPTKPTKPVIEPKKPTKPKPVTEPTKPSSNQTASNKASNVVADAKTYVGKLKYIWGGTSLTTGADCSGFVQALYKKQGITLPRTSREQSTVGTKVSLADAKPGDLVFYAEGGVVGHVAIYIGNGQIVHASNSKDGVKISNVNYRTPYCIRRVA